jgi:DNA polymerase-3 subunit delta
MIFKSYLLEKNIDQLLNCTVFLFYGDNEGLKKVFKESLKKKSQTKTLLFFQEEIVKNQDLLLNEVFNKSLFNEKKTIFIEQADDKILKIVENFEKLEDVEIFLFASALNKKSKLRSFFEKSKIFGISPCYEDNVITIRKIIQEKLRKFQGLTPEIIDYIIQNTGLNRYKIINEIKKIETYFNNNKIEANKLDDLLNLGSSDDFNQLKDEALNGNQNKTNKLISDTVLEDEKSIYYLNIINQRALDLLKILRGQKNIYNVEQAINDLKPPVFWKDKPNFIIQLKKWNQKKLKNILSKVFELELKIKTNSSINKNILMKNLIVDICVLANS